MAAWLPGSRPPTQAAQPIELPQDDVGRDAMRILASNACRPRKIVAVNPDSVLFVNQDGQARTAWLLRDGKDNALRIRLVDGFPPYPPDDFRPLLPPDDMPRAA